MELRAKGPGRAGNQSVTAVSGYKSIVPIPPLQFKLQPGKCRGLTNRRVGARHSRVYQFHPCARALGQLGLKSLPYCSPILRLLGLFQGGSFLIRGLCIELNHVVYAEDSDGSLSCETKALYFGYSRFEDPRSKIITNATTHQIQTRKLFVCYINLIFCIPYAFIYA